VVVQGPVGVPLTAEETARFSGAWQDGERRVYQVAREEDSGHWQVTGEEDGEKQTMRFLVTRVGEDVVIFWGVTEHPGWLAPARLIDGDGAVTLVRPDLGYLREAVKAGQLTAGPELGQGWYALEPAGLLELLAGKAIWDLDYGRALFQLTTPPDRGREKDE